MAAFPFAILNSCPMTGRVAITNYCPIRRLLSICHLAFLSNQRRAHPRTPPPGIELSLLHYLYPLKFLSAFVVVFESITTSFRKTFLSLSLFEIHIKKQPVVTDPGCHIGRRQSLIISLAVPMGAPGRLPFGSKFFSFSCSYDRLEPHLCGWLPLLWEILDAPLCLANTSFTTFPTPKKIKETA